MAPAGFFPTEEQYKADRKRADELQLFTETFYYIAGRVRTILQIGLIPGLKNFECKGVRNVRNKLLEHPEKGDSGVFVQDFAFGEERGPVIKAIRPRHQRAIFPDAGLYVNAEEFRTNLERLLSDRLKEVTP